MVQGVPSSGMNNTVNSAGKESPHNQSASSVPKLVVRKNQGLVQEDSNIWIIITIIGTNIVETHSKV